ncbi:hypothetical protein KPSA1_03983 [Pseudomonas syringae pv. actinidiae]|uniref:Uncharacterized protein n=1 Tax=Pseudomonas syringae pv. actinidiae TaxID=103796 RepID=A0A2V0QCB7_PSESF|nr:hypothetical protein KPSA1_03983 [Pseudomonas syringae pv. actinidiae]
MPIAHLANGGFNLRKVRGNDFQSMSAAAYLSIGTDFDFFCMILELFYF